MPGYKLIFTPEARTDVDVTASYYNGQLKGLGKRYKAEVKNQLMLIRQNPLSRSVRYNNVRFALINNFPYSIHYTIEGNSVIVHAILCDYRNPSEYWTHGEQDR